jgi:opacity protein-like surface antigen
MNTTTQDTSRTRGAVRRLAAAIAMAGALAAAAPAAATDVGVRLGYYDGADADEPVPVFGVYGRVDIPGPLNLELSADYREESLAGGALEATVVPARVSAVLNFLPGFSPYLLAGVGADFVSIGFAGAWAGRSDESDIALAWHAGGGLEIGLGPVSVVGDLRYCGVAEVGNEAVRAALGRAYDPSGWYASVSAAISF